MYIDWTYIVLVLPFVLIAMGASAMVNSTFKKYSSQSTAGNLTGAQAARRVLDANGLQHIRIAHIPGKLTDNYNPSDEVLSLSDSTYDDSSAAAVGVACHEAGHAIQHANGYIPVEIRTAMVPVVNIANGLSMPLIIGGIILSYFSQFFVYAAYVGVVLFSLVAIFQLITLPVEFNASSRAMSTIREYNLLQEDEMTGARKVLTAAAFTYVAGLLVTLMNLLRFLIILGGRNRN